VTRPTPPRPFDGAAPEDATPGPQVSLPGLSAWSDSDARLASGPRAVFSTNPPSRAIDQLPSIGQIGRYALKYRIGEGGLGTVFAAHDPVLSRLVAIKTVHVEVPAAERDAFNALFLNEARAAAGLSHRHIVTVFDAGLSDGGAYIAMELLKGVDLRQLRLEGWQPLPAQVAQLTRQVAEALAYAHAHGVIHLDIKPANIFMVGRTQPRVLDFGIARITHRFDAPAGQDLSGGSPYYMAPEQVLQQPVDARCDVFSLGVVMYELLAGVRPFRGATLAQIQRAVLQHRPQLASEVAPAAPRALALIAARATATDPDARYPSAAAMARDLQQWLEIGEPAFGAARGRHRPPQRRAALAAIAVLPVAAGGGWIAWLQHGRPARDLPTAPPTPPKGLVQIDVSPSAQVEVDGISVGTAPPLNQLALPEGRHTVTLRHGDHAPHTMSVEVASGQPVLVTHRFVP